VQPELRVQQGAARVNNHALAITTEDDTHLLQVGVDR
jgi:hypothetical protein